MSACLFSGEGFGGEGACTPEPVPSHCCWITLLLMPFLCRLGSQRCSSNSIVSPWVGNAAHPILLCRLGSQRCSSNPIVSPWVGNAAHAARLTAYCWTSTLFIEPPLPAVAASYHCQVLL